MNKPLAVQLGRVCQYIYPPCDDKFLTPDSPDVTIIHDKKRIPTSYAGVLRYPGKTVLVFQGTLTGESVQAVKDWLENFRLLQTSTSGLPGKVHKGFADQWNLIRDDVVANLKGGFNGPLYVTGHSQGGAVAVLATKALELEGINVTSTYTFASPRPGDGVFADSVKTPVFRLEFGDDIVPHVAIHAVALGVLQGAAATIPQLKSLLSNVALHDTLGYVSVGTLTYRAANQDLRVDVSATEEHALSVERTAHLLLARQNLYQNHHMRNYIDMLS